MVMIMGGILFLAGCDLQSSSSDSTSGTNTDTGTPPPSQLVGTAALAGESATYTLTPASSPSSSVIGRKALYTVSGNIRYRGTDFSVTGIYANYAPEAGNGTFSGTISGSTLTITTATNSGLPVVSFSGKGFGNQSQRDLEDNPHNGRGQCNLRRCLERCGSHDGRGSPHTFFRRSSGF